MKKVFVIKNIITGHYYWYNSPAGIAWNDHISNAKTFASYAECEIEIKEKFKYDFYFLQINLIHITK